MDSLKDPLVINSAADCRLTVWPTLEAATQFWIKSRSFTLASLVQDEALSSHPAFKDGASMAIFRLSPADWHRCRSPVKGKTSSRAFSHFRLIQLKLGVMGSIKHIPGQYYTVNPQAILSGNAVFEANRRDVTTITCKKPNGEESPVIFVAVGAMRAFTSCYSNFPPLT